MDWELLAGLVDDRRKADRENLTEPDRYGTSPAHPRASTRRVADYVGGDEEASGSVSVFRCVDPEQDWIDDTVEAHRSNRRRP